MNLIDLIRAALKEDMPQGDLTTESLALSPRQGRAKLISKQDLILSGTAAFEETVLCLEPSAKLKWHFDEGQQILNKQIICTLQGDLMQILKAERVALNFLMHLSGIATYTSRFVALTKPYSAKILDTRKTLPGYRNLEKRAVVHGGGFNHRMNLSEAILIKDNHISVMGGINEAVKRVRSNSTKPIEVEARTLKDVSDCIELKVDRILLDNMDLETTRRAVNLIPQEIQVEASGNMNLDRVADVASTGVHFISIGALTHSAPSADISLMFQWEES
jgi:nicotinate-nucleotide pyrophosphorylase (carboxylating)